MVNLFFDQLENGWDRQYEKGFKAGKIEGIEEGKKEQTLIAVVQLVEKLKINVGQAMDVLDIPNSKRIYYMGMLETLGDNKVKSAEGSMLKQRLVKIAGKSKISMTFDRILDAIAIRGKENLGYINIGLLNIKEKNLKPQGNSKAYVEILSPKGIAMGIERSVTVEKQVEGLIEGLVTRVITSRYNTNNTEVSMIIEGITLMICKRMGLDVRTYLTNDNYKMMVENDVWRSNFLNLCLENYEYVYNKLGLEQIIG